MTNPLQSPATPEEAEQLVRMHVVDKMSLSQIGKVVGRSTSSVKGIVARNRPMAVALMRGEPLPQAYVPEVALEDIVTWTHPDTGVRVSMPKLRCLEGKWPRI